MAAAGSLGQPEQKTRPPVASRAPAIGRPPLWKQAKTPHASPASRDTPPRAPKPEWSQSPKAEPLSAPVANSPMSCLRVQRTTKPRAAYQAREDDLPRRPQTPARFQPATSTSQKSPANSPATS